MPPALKVITWSVLGTILGFAFVYGGFEAYYRAFEQVAAKDLRSWQNFTAMMMGGAGAAVGFFAGIVFGIVRGRRVGK